MTKSVAAPETSGATVDIDLSGYQLGWRDQEAYAFKQDVCRMCGEGHPPPMDPCFKEIGAH